MKEALASAQAYEEFVYHHKHVAPDIKHHRLPALISGSNDPISRFLFKRLVTHYCKLGIGKPMNRFPCDNVFALSHD
jgi:hypothetical protein